MIFAVHFMISTLQGPTFYNRSLTKHRNGTEKFEKMTENHGQNHVFKVTKEPSDVLC